MPAVATYRRRYALPLVGVGVSDSASCVVETRQRGSAAGEDFLPHVFLGFKQVHIVVLHVRVATAEQNGAAVCNLCPAVTPAALWSVFRGQ